MVARGDLRAETAIIDYTGTRTTFGGHASVSAPPSRLADRRLSPWLLVAVYATGTVLGYGFDCGLFPAADCSVSGWRCILPDGPPQYWIVHCVGGRGVWRNVGWGRIPPWLAGLGIYTAFWPTVLVLLTASPGPLDLSFSGLLWMPCEAHGLWHGFDPWSRLLLVNDGLAQWLSVFGP